MKQYDKTTSDVGKTLTFELYEADMPYTIPTDAVITVRGTKADKTGFEYECTYNGNQVDVNVQQQMTVFACKYDADLRITQNGNIIGTANFKIDVTESALADDTAISETELPLLEKAIEAETVVLAEVKKIQGESAQITQNKTDIATISTKLTTDESQIATNTSNIATNTSNIATNTSNIATNKSDIATNKDNIATNTSNIATNKSDIATNKDNIATNTSNIATNTTNLKNATTYSTTETTIGTWIDGSMVYRKVIKWTGEIPTATETSIPHKITNLKRVISAFMFSDSNGRFMPITSASETPTFVTTLCGWTSTALLVRSSGNWGSREWTIIVEYTK